MTLPQQSVSKAPAPPASRIAKVTPSRAAIKTVPPVEDRSALIRYSVAVILCAAALIVSLIAAPFIKNVILIFFWPAVIGSAIIGGLGPGVFASVLSLVLADYFLIAPLKSFTLTDPAEVVPFIVFLVTSY